MAERNNKVSEDVVEYFLFPSLQEAGNRSFSSDDLNELIKTYLTSLSPLLIDVIWQNGGFKLKPIEEAGTVPAHLHGETNFGENIEDEWFVVYLLYELTRQFPGLAARVHDSDEEFLLIEAADALPKWLNPETAENRVYIYNGALHIIPVPQSPADVAMFPHTVSSIGDAVECIRTYPDQTRASPKIQTAVNKRLSKFPGLMKEHIHHTHCYIPASIAAILDEKPQLVAPAVRAFYYRDPVDLKCCRTFRYFRPGTRVMHRTRMTRCLYAQLVHQNFQPDKRSGWVMPSSSNPKFQSHDLGMKLAHGFEILCSKCESGVTSGSTSEDIPKGNIKWQQYVKALQSSNYFRGELEGSFLYKKLLANAWLFYRENLAGVERSDDIGSEIVSMLKTVPVDIEGRRRAEQDLQSPDDESWLTLTPESLDEMMKERSGNLGNDDDPDGVFDLGKVADSMKAFVKNVSSVEGAEFPSTVDEEDEEDADIQFDGSGFITAMQEIFEFEEGDSDSSSDMSEYGWEDSEDEAKPKSSSRPGKIRRPPSLDKYMDIMDRELAKTDVGKSFEKQAKPKKQEKVQSKPSKDVNDEDDDFQPVDIDMNTVKNLLQSYGAQEGLPGPTSNILGSMGVVIPPNKDSAENGERAAVEGVAKPEPKPRPVPQPRTKVNKNTQRTTPARAPRARLDSKETDV